ncbi:NTP transferase domain-containing protein [Candidatus Falkowbacteria bacterium]|nr:NTP transferase domain-containing protein [Candidatus Falkowbacteria bacterium]
MKGIILAGGKGTRLSPLTKVTSKQLLPVYDKPMIFYPLETMLRAGIKDVLIIIAPDNAGQFLHLLGSGREFGEGIKFSYEIQEHPGGLPEAFIIGANFIGDDNVTLILGDNIFADDLAKDIASFESGGRIFCKKVPDPERSGVAVFDADNKVTQIVEKPKEWISDYAIVGAYVYDNRVIEIARGLQPSARNELEIVDLHKAYLAKGELDVRFLEGEWFDAGTFNSLLEVNNFMAARVKK